MARADTVIALVVNSTTHAATTNTRNALVSAGFTLSNILTTLESGTIPACDIIVICRAIVTQALYDAKIRPAFESGTPVIFGSANAFTGNQSIAATYAKLTGNWEVGSSTLGVNAYQLTGNTHPITDGQSAGYQDLLIGHNFIANIYSSNLEGTGLVGLIEPEPFFNSAGLVNLIPVEAGHIDLLGNPTAARAVLFGDVYGGQTAYTQFGIDLIGASIDWALGGGAPPASRRRSPLLLTPW